MFSKILKWAGKTSSIIILVVILIVVCIFLFLGPIAEFLIEKYDERYTGRNIEMSKMRINLFTGGVNIHDITIFEQARKDTFTHVKHIYTNLEWTHFFRGDYDVVEVSLYRPYVSVIQNGSSFNFDDLVERFITSNDTTSHDSDDEEIHYRIENIHVDSARIKYRETIIKSAFSFINANATCPLVAWDEPDHIYEFSTDLSSGGSLHSIANLNINTLLYTLQAEVEEVNLSPFLPYVQDAMKVNKMDGLVTLDFDLKGNINDPYAIALRANNILQNFSLVDFQDDELTSVEKMTMGIDSVNTGENIYDWGALMMNKPYAKLELYTDGDNYTRLLKDTLATSSSDSSIVTPIDYSNPFRFLIRYAANIVNEYVMHEYTIDSITVSNGRVLYNDYTLHEKFTSDLDSLYIHSGKLNSKDAQLKFLIDCHLNKTGVIKADLSMDPHNLENLTLLYSAKNVRISSFSPYSVYYVAHPFADGLIYYDNETKILNHIIDSENKLEVKRIEVGKKVKNSTAMNLPLRLAVVILRDKDGNINLDLPVEGNLDDPNYHLGKVIWSVIKNLLVKAVTSPFKLLAAAVDADEEDIRSIQFEYLADSLTKKQQKNLNMLARVLKVKPELKVQLVYKSGNADETEMLAAYEAKKRYVLKIDSVREEDPTPGQIKQIQELSINDSSFVHYLDRNLLFEGTLPPIEKCKRFVGKRRLENKMEEIVANRKKAITDFLASQEEVKPEGFEIVDAEEGEHKSDGVPKFDVEFGLTDE